MTSLPLKTHAVSPVMEYGRVADAQNNFFEIRTTYGRIKAERAASCLLQPKRGDDVLLVFDATGAGFILAVLRQSTDSEIEDRLVFDRPVKIEVRNGGLSLTAQRNVTIGSDEEIVCAAPKLGLHADEGLATFDRLTFWGRTVKGRIKRLKTIAVDVEQIFCRLTQRLTNAFRYVREHEDVQLGSTRVLVDDTLAMQAKNASCMAEEIVTINGEQINLG